MAEIDLKKKFPNMTLSKSPPTLLTINGCGLAVYGGRDHDAETGTYVTTYCLTLVFVPVLFLRAYRVAGAPNGGWYFIGREPLSRFATMWNRLLVITIFAVSLGIAAYFYTSTPAYKAQRQMAAARKRAEAGEVGQAGRIYQGLSLAGQDESENATAALVALLDGPCKQAPLKESAGAYVAAAQVARRRHAPSPAEVAAKATALVSERGDADPAGGVAVLDAVRPLVLDTRDLDARRLVLLRKWAEKDPGNLDVVIPLASLLAEQDHLADAKKLLLPVRDKLGDGEGARVLGTILSRDRDFDGAYALLWPYVQPRLDRLHAAEKRWGDAIAQIEDREIKKLDDKNGPADFYQQYENASNEDAKRALVQEYLNGRMKNDPDYLGAQEEMERESAVVPVTLELGIVMLQRAHEMTKPADRTAQLEAAEKVFLAVRGVAGETDEYRLSLGEVYYWLGKQTEGRKLFDDYLAGKSRSYEAVFSIARTFRQLGMDAETRTLAEEAYGKGKTSDEKYSAAGLRAIVSTDNQDRIDWLSKANTRDPRTKGSLARTTGDQEMELGREDEAVRQYNLALEAYASMPRTATTLNESALTCHAIFEANGDHAALERCYDYYQQAVELEPSDSVLLFNAGSVLVESALAEIAGHDIDLRALRATGDFDLLEYLYNDEATRAAVARKVRSHPAISRARSYLEKVAIIAPKSDRTFVTLAQLHVMTQDEPALRTLEQRLRAAGVDVSDRIAYTKKYFNGTKDAEDIPKLRALLKRRAERAKNVRPKGGITAAVALSDQVDTMLDLDTFTGAGDLDQAVALAEEAYRLAPSSGSFGLLRSALLRRAARDVRKNDAAFDQVCKANARATGISSTVAFVASQPGPSQQAVLQNSDFRRAIKLTVERTKQFPLGGSEFQWALLKGAEPDEAEKMAARIRSTPRLQVEQSISELLNPASAREALDSYWMSQIVGKPEEGFGMAKSVVAQGIPVLVPLSTP